MTLRPLPADLSTLKSSYLFLILGALEPSAENGNETSSSHSCFEGASGVWGRGTLKCLPKSSALGRIYPAQESHEYIFYTNFYVYLQDMFIYYI